MNRWVTNCLIAAGCSVVFLIYIVFIAGYMPLGISRMIITAALLVFLGVLSGCIMIGALPVKLIPLLLLPVIHIAYEGIDPAKPILSYLFGAVEVLCLWLGAA